jgi:hypothetical protein
MQTNVAVITILVQEMVSNFSAHLAGYGSKLESSLEIAR